MCLQNLNKPSRIITVFNGLVWSFIMKFKFAVPLLGLVLLATGCSTTIPVNYVASPAIKGSGPVQAGSFSYAPAERGEVRQNQFQSAQMSMGSMYLAENVSDLLKQSLRKELIAAGFDPDGTTDIQISGVVEKFLYDWIGFVEMDMYLDVKYTVTRNGNIIHEQTIRSHKALPKAPGYDSEAIRTTISDNLTKLMLELRAKKII